MLNAQFTMADLLQTVANSGSLKRLMSAIETADVAELLKGEGPFTILAPTDEAFDNVPSDTMDELLSDAHRLKQVILHHVLFGDVRSDNFAEIDEAPTVEGSYITVERGDRIKLNEAYVTASDILTDNGVIHVIDSVLMPAIVV